MKKEPSSSSFRSVFMRGLIALAPMTLTIAIVVWLYGIFENAMSAPIKKLIGAQYYFPGLGIIVALVVIFIAGAVLNTWVIQKIYALGERILKKIPFVKSLYVSLSDLMSFFHSEKRFKKGKVVMVEIHGMRLIGLVTRETFDDLPDGLAKDKEVAVYLPLSYQIGGFTLMLNRSHIEPIEMSVEEGMRFALTAGVTGKNKK